MKVTTTMKTLVSSSAVHYPTALEMQDHDEIVSMTTRTSARVVLSDHRSLRLSSSHGSHSSHSSMRISDSLTLNDSWTCTMADALESALAGGAA